MQAFPIQLFFCFPVCAITPWLQGLGCRKNVPAGKSMRHRFFKTATIATFGLALATTAFSYAQAASAFVPQIVSKRASDAFVRQLPLSARGRIQAPAGTQQRQTRTRVVRRQQPQRQQRRGTTAVQPVISSNVNITDFGAPDSRRSLSLPNVREGVSVRIIRRQQTSGQ